MPSTGAAMRKVSIRNLLAHKIRFILTVLSIVLGTAFIAGSFMFTNSMSKTFDTIAESSYADVDAVVNPERQGGSALDQEFREKLAKDPEVAQVNVSQQKSVIIAKQDHELLNSGGAPSVVMPYYPEAQSVTEPMVLVDGRAPRGAEEIILNQSAAERNNVSVGDELTLVDPNGRHQVTVAGLYTIELEVGGFIGVAMDEPAYFQTFRPDGAVQELALSAKAMPSDRFVDYLKEKYPGAEFRTGSSVAQETTDQVNQALSFVNYFLIAFGLIALLVGTFIIANTFSMIVAQRMREFALLRSLGTSQRQLTSSVVFEALVVGVIGSVLGILAGAGLVRLIYWGMSKAGLGLPDAGVQLTPLSVAAPVLLGVVVTVLSAWAPARRAGKVRPVEAMRSGDASSSSSLKLRTVLGLLGIIAGVVAAVLGGWSMTDASTGQRASVVGFGALLLIVGTFLVLPAVSIAVVGLIGKIIGAPFGAVGRLASTNSQRNPRRTATTAFALTLGIALVAVIGIFGATMKNSVSELTESSVTSDYVVSGPPQANFPVPREVVGTVRGVPSVKDAVSVGNAPIAVGDISAVPGHPLNSVVDGNPGAVFATAAVDGDLSLSKPGVLIDETVAGEKNLTVGDMVPLNFGVSESLTLTEVPVLGIYEPNPLLGPAVISQSAIEQGKESTPQLAGNDSLNASVFLLAVSGQKGADKDQLREQLEDAVEDYLVVQVLTTQEFAGTQATVIDQLLNILYSLLALAIIVAVLGIINTLALNVVERRQEVGMLRAVGTKRSQIRGMITLEAVQIALFGALVGVGLGLFLGWAFVTALGDNGLGSVVIPWSQVGLMIGGSAVVGIVAAVWPAMKAAKTPPLEAIAD
ncbi:ABC transporter permease YtrF precursor [Corynebacterium urogenitale]|uniref:ABC transporter permease YtrF n=1 Tax=Corynebacterium urogenitale TaxID=2487892 RepID=A0A5J6Z459_9CORY|nr:ABC transporter permease [Corynebacterium urogenitale]QFQ01836.1 ABC transporter permease YtrF precursor [Corynebacterium urogenitale]